MTCVTASAPGKLIVAGEYAVLDGAPAICMAVNRRARVSVAASDDAEYIVSAPGFLSASQNFASMSAAADALPLLWEVWQGMPKPATGKLKMNLDSREFRAASGAKLGLGSSAAVAVALTAALDRFAGGDIDTRDAAMTAHRRFQGGAGSGADIACSFAGGVIEYRVQHGECPALSWPADLHYALLWSGRSADTATQLKKLAATEQSPSRKELAESALAVAAAWRADDSATLLATLAHYTDTLRRFDADHRLGIFGAGHAELTDAVTEDVVYKPCGAGAGDLGIALSTDPAALAAFIDSARQSRFEALDLRIDTSGVEVEATAQ